MCGLRDRKCCSLRREGAFGVFPQVTSLCLSDLLQLILYMPLLSYDKMLPQMPNFMVWLLRQHPVHDGQLRRHSNLVVHDQPFLTSFSSSTEAMSQKENNYLQTVA